MPYTKRIKKLSTVLKKNEKFPYIIFDLINIKYLTGFSGSNAIMLFFEKNIYFLTDGRYEEYAKNILPSFVNFVLLKGEASNVIKNIIKSENKKNLLVENHFISLADFLNLKKKLRGIKLEPSKSEINNLRMIKDETEIKKLKTAAEITDGCVDMLVKNVAPGMTEWEVSLKIENFYKTHGCRRNSFDSIVASGKNSSMPHYETSFSKKIEKGDVLLVDMGCEYQGYNSDLTRTMFVNSIDKKIEDIYKIVFDAQLNAIRQAKPGRTTGFIDDSARSVITKKGFGEYFGHSTGHGYGLEIHELPYVKQEGEIKLKKDMTITIEPGIYVPDLGGVRIEDMVLITSKGCEVLTKSSKNITII